MGLAQSLEAGPEALGTDKTPGIHRTKMKAEGLLFIPQPFYILLLLGR